MPAYVIMPSSLGRIGETIDATLCDPSVSGYPDRRTEVPVRVRLISEQVLSVDDDPRGIIWSEGGSGTTTFLVDGSTKIIRNRERRAALARASELLKQLTSSLMPLAAESAEPEGRPRACEGSEGTEMTKVDSALPIAALAAR